MAQASAETNEGPTAGRLALADPVKTAARTLDVFEVFANAKRPLTLTELAAQLGSPMSSCHALVRTLQTRGYVYVLDERKRVYPTKRLLAMAQLIAQNDPFLERIVPILKTLQQETGETVILGKRQGNAVTYLEVIEGRHTIRYVAAPGDTKPLHSSAIGKAMLGSMPDTELSRLLKRLPLAPVTETTVTDAAALFEEISKGREKGFFLTRGENVPEVMAIAIARCLGDEWYGVAVAGPIGRLGIHLDSLASSLLDAGRALRRIDEGLRGAM